MALCATFQNSNASFFQSTTTLWKFIGQLENLSRFVVLIFSVSYPEIKGSIINGFIMYVKKQLKDISRLGYLIIFIIASLIVGEIICKYILIIEKDPSFSTRIHLFCKPIGITLRMIAVHKCSQRNNLLLH